MIDLGWTQWLETLSRGNKVLVTDTDKRRQDHRDSVANIRNRIDQKIGELEFRDRIELVSRLSEDPRDDVRLAMASQLAAGAWTWVPLDLTLELFEALGATESSEVRELVATSLGNWVDPSTKLAAIAVLMGMRRANDSTYAEADDGLRAVDDALFKLSGSV